VYSFLARFLILALLISLFTVTTSLLSALLTLFRTEDAFKIAIALSAASYMLGPLFSLRLLEKFGRSPLRLSDGLAAAFLIAATVPLPYIVFTRLVPAVTGLSLSPAGFGISLFVLIMCALISLYGSVGLTRRSSQPLADE